MLKRHVLFSCLLIGLFLVSLTAEGAADEESFWGNPISDIPSAFKCVCLSHGRSCLLPSVSHALRPLCAEVFE